MISIFKVQLNQDGDFIEDRTRGLYKEKRRLKNLEESDECPTKKFKIDAEKGIASNMSEDTEKDTRTRRVRASLTAKEKQILFRIISKSDGGVLGPVIYTKDQSLNYKKNE